jgi:AcrR family transcriptional regulator
MPRVVDHALYRQDLIERCVSLFAREGYTAVTMRRIADELRVSTGTLYHYFPNKESLFLGVVEEVVRQDVREAEEALPIDLPEDSLPAFILAYIASREDWFIQQHLVVCEYLRGKAPRDVAKDPKLREMGDVYHHGTGRLLGIDPEQAKTLLAFLKGLLIQRFYDGGRTSLEAQEPYVRALLEHMREGR